MQDVKCKQCKTMFEVDDSKRNWKSIKLCSDECRRAVAAEKKRKKYQPKKSVISYCQNCGDSFKAASTIGTRQKFCSRDCWKAVKRDRAHQEWADSQRVRACAHCDSDFLPRKFAAGKQKYCSHECQVRAISKRHNGKYKRSGSYQQEFKVVRSAALERDKVCVLCGSDERPQVHHLDNSGRLDSCNNSLDNLAVLCGDCHSAIHKVTLAKVNGEWCLDGRIFDIVKITDPIPIKS